MKYILLLLKENITKYLILYYTKQVCYVSKPDHYISHKKLSTK